MDQSGFMLQPTRRRTWALSGHTPIHKGWDRHDRLSVQAAVTLPPRRQRLGVYFRMYEHNIDRQDVVSFVGSAAYDTTQGRAHFGSVECPSRRGGGMAQKVSASTHHRMVARLCTRIESG